MIAKLIPASASPPSTELLHAVRGAFVAQGTSLAKWCSQNDVRRQWATAALTGLRDGPAARELREKIIASAFPIKLAAA